MFRNLITSKWPLFKEVKVKPEKVISLKFHKLTYLTYSQYMKKLFLSIKKNPRLSFAILFSLHV